MRWEKYLLCRLHIQPYLVSILIPPAPPNLVFLGSTGLEVIAMWGSLQPTRAIFF